MLSEATIQALTVQERDIPNGRATQSCTLPDKVVAMPSGHVLRFKFHFDSSYLEQSKIRIEIFSTETKQWNELWTFSPYRDFDVVGSAPAGELPEASVLLKTTYSRDRKVKAKSWSEMYPFMYRKAEELLSMIDQAPQSAITMKV